MVWIKNNSVGKNISNRENIQRNFYYHENTKELKNEMKHKKVRLAISVI